MATTFNFTVRAEDDQGAFADRDFSMTVRNTSVDRYLITTATDAYTSPDMTTWTKRIGQGGLSAQYGGGKWLIQVSATTYRLSSDGINFSLLTMPSSHTIPPTWIHDRWVYIHQMSSPSTVLNVYHSFDGIEWEILASQAGDFTLYIHQAPSYHDGVIYLSKTSAVSQYTKIDIDSKQISNVTAAYKSVGTSPVFSAPFRFNDLWVVASQTTGSTSSMFTYSTDLITWNAGGVWTGLGSGFPTSQRIVNLSYNNGVIFGTCYISATNRPNSILLTRDGKDGIGVTPSASGATPTNTKQLSMVTKGKMYIVIGSQKAYSSDLGTTWVDAAVDFPSDLGSTPVTGMAAIQ